MIGITESQTYLEMVRRDIREYNAFPLRDLLYSEKSSWGEFRSAQEFRRWSNSVSVSSNHVRFSRIPTYHPKPDHIAKRGVITTFSRHSRLRLRESLANACLEASDTFGVTLTLPWKEGLKDLSSLLSDYRECFNRFGVSFRRTFPTSAAIFRHELQVRRVPHAHLVCFFSHLDLRALGVGKFTRADQVKLQRIVFDLWFRAIKFDLRGGSAIGFARHGVKVDYLSDRDSMFRYISDHASKSKQAQLGYKGRQWGFLNRALLSKRVSVNYDFRFQEDLVFFQRHIYKLCRFNVRADCVFGCKLSHKTNGISIIFVKGSTVRRLVRYINARRFAVLRSCAPPEKNGIMKLC